MYSYYVPSSSLCNCLRNCFCVIRVNMFCKADKNRSYWTLIFSRTSYPCNTSQIGFLCGALIDNREAFVLRAGRVKDACQGQGYYKALRSHLYQTMSTIKSVKYEKVVVFNAIAEKLLQPDSGFEHIAMQVIIRSVLSILQQYTLFHL